ncbi:MAG: DUF5682 family protein, partial [Thermomicrobiales bacterium]
LLDNPDQRAEWQDALRGIAGRDGVHGLVRGRCCRLLLEDRALDDADLERLARLALSPATPTPDAAAWITGVTQGSGLLLLQLDRLWLALDRWLSDLHPETFVETLPLLRRAFSQFQGPERRAMGEKVKRLHRGGQAADAEFDGLAGLDRARADRVLPVLAAILGVRGDE